ncbi:MAG: F0F1 ATP synthase subunit delta [Propionibacteriales bacterium]|nr:F0F1 ATP synthase subunit delta [Propionibacteriales bacterium]
MSQASEARTSALDAIGDRAGADAGLSAELFAIADALEANPAVRKALADPGQPAEARTGLAHQLFDGKVSTEAVDVLAEASGLRLSGGLALLAAIERQGVRAELRFADQAGTLADVEDELFRFGRLVQSDNTLREAIGGRTVPLTHRQELVRGLLDGKAKESTVRLAQRAVQARERTFDNTLTGYVTLAALQRRRTVATVTVAKALDAEQIERLGAALGRQVGRPVAIQLVVDPEVVGGVRVALGDEVIEGTVSGRLEQARRELTD